MPSSFRLEDPLPDVARAKPFGVRSKGVPSFECLRILNGSIDIRNSTTGKLTKLRHCHLSQRSRRLSANTISETIDLVFDGNLSQADVEQYLTRSTSQNRVFWTELRSEICFCLFAKKQKRHVEAFLHLYRLLELSSVSLPLIYATKINDFRRSLDFIKSLSRNDRDKDLAILHYFCEELSNSGSLGGLSIDFPFNYLSMPAKGHFRSQLDSCVLSNSKIEQDDLTSDPNDGVKVNFKSVPSFLVTNRNRLFHNALSSENFKLDLIQGSEPVCAILIGPGLYWFSLVLVEIVKAEASRYV